MEHLKFSICIATSETFTKYLTQNVLPFSFKQLTYIHVLQLLHSQQQFWGNPPDFYYIP